MYVCLSVCLFVDSNSRIVERIIMKFGISEFNNSCRVLDVVSLSVCLSVCLFVDSNSRMAERIIMKFGISEFNNSCRQWYDSGYIWTTLTNIVYEKGVFLLLLFTANGFVPGGSGTTIHKKHKITQTHALITIHNTQNYKHNKVHVLHTLKTQKWNYFNPTKNLK